MAPPDFLEAVESDEDLACALRAEAARPFIPDGGLRVLGL
jgi:hypothetical protein